MYMDQTQVMASDTMLSLLLLCKKSEDVLDVYKELATKR